MIPRAEKFGVLITADHNVLNEDGESRNNHWYAVVVHDLATQWNQSYPYERVPAHRDSHASSSHEPSLEPMRSVDWASTEKKKQKKSGNVDFSL